MGPVGGSAPGAAAAGSADAPAPRPGPLEALGDELHCALGGGLLQDDIIDVDTLGLHHVVALEDEAPPDRSVPEEVTHVVPDQDPARAFLPAAGAPAGYGLDLVDAVVAGEAVHELVEGLLGVEPRMEGNGGGRRVAEVEGSDGQPGGAIRRVRPRRRYGQGAARQGVGKQCHRARSAHAPGRRHLPPLRAAGGSRQPRHGDKQKAASQHLPAESVWSHTSTVRTRIVP